MKAIYKCPKCNQIKNVRFNIGQKLKSPICDKCNIEMQRQYKIQIGDVVSDEMLELGQKMLYE